MPEHVVDLVLHEPGGQPLRNGRRLTYRQARTWAKRADALIGRAPCGGDVEWFPQEQRAVVAASLRHAEGKDCDTGGDVLLFRLSNGRPLLVIDERS